MSDLKWVDDAMARADRAPEGTWEYHFSQTCQFPHSVSQVRPDGSELSIVHSIWNHEVAADTMKFVAHSRQDIPRLCHTVKALVEALEYARSIFDRNGIVALRGEAFTDTDIERIDAALAAAGGDGTDQEKR